MADLLYRLIKKGRITVDNVKYQYKAAVQALLDAPTPEQ